MSTADHESQRAHLPRLEIRRDLVCHAGDLFGVSGTYHGMNLSDVFEYLSPEEHRLGYGKLIDRSEPCARLVYWNLFNERTCADSRARPCPELVTRLHPRDQVWFYGALQIDEVNPGAGPARREFPPQR